MKKRIGCVLILVGVLLFAFPALAQRLTMQQLYEQWEEQGYPDYVGGVYFDTDTQALAVLLKENTEARQQEILAQLAPEETVSFGSMKYSYNELKQLQDTFVWQDGIYTLGVGWISDETGVHGFGENGKEFRLVIGVDESKFEEYTALYAAQYGDMVHVEAQEQPTLALDEEAPLLDEPTARLSSTAIILIVFICLAAVVLLARRRRQKDRVE